MKNAKEAFEKGWTDGGEDKEEAGMSERKGTTKRRQEQAEKPQAGGDARPAFFWRRRAL